MFKPMYQLGCIGIKRFDQHCFLLNHLDNPQKNYNAYLLEQMVKDQQHMLASILQEAGYKKVGPP
jgi:hypothetical protein